MCLSVQSKLRSVYWPRSICFVVRWARGWRGRHIGRRHISNVLLKTIHIYFKDHPTLISVWSHVLIPAVISYLGVNHSRPPASSDVGRGGSTVVCQVGLQNEWQRQSLLNIVRLKSADHWLIKESRVPNSEDLNYYCKKEIVLKNTWRNESKNASVSVRVFAQRKTYICIA